MKIQIRSLFLVLRVVADVVLVAAAYLLAYWLRFKFPAPLGKPDIQSYLVALPAVAFIYIVVFRLSGLYRPRRSISVIDEFYSAMMASCLAVLVTIAAAFAWKNIFSYSTAVILLGFVLSIIIVGAARVTLASLESRMHRLGKGVTPVLVVGAGSMGTMIKRRLDNHPGLGYRVSGFLDDDPAKIGTEVEGVPVLGSTDEIVSLVRKTRAGSVLVALKNLPHRRMLELIGRCRGENVDFKIVSDLFEIITGPVGIEEIDGIPVFGLKEEPLERWTNRALKRAVDVVVSSIALAPALIVFPFIALTIKLTSGGPVLYRQERVGHDEKKFWLYKFRSMRVGAEAGTGPVWTKSGDPRRTRVGAFLRRFSLDEIPQFVCVLKGDMSLVGPRPERATFVNEFKERIPRYLERHKVKSGITGWAQINGLRGDVDIEERTNCDIYYIENWSLWFDLKILIRTAFEFLFHRQAY